MKDNLGKETFIQLSIVVEKPKIGLVCNKLSSVRVSCEINLLDKLPEDIFAYSIQFGQENVIGQKSGEHSFASFGEHEIVATVIDNNGNSSQLKTIVNLEATYLTPIAKFVYEAKLSYRTFFDAKLLLAQGRSVEKYNWSFGDGQSLETTASEVQHNYANKGYYNVNLTVTDQNGATDTQSLQIYIYDAEVAFYDSENDQDLLGVDSDNDDIRDDVQVWINHELKDNLAAKTIIKKLASNFSLEFKNLSDQEKLRELFKKEEIIELCLRSKIESEERVDYLLQMLRMQYFNTGMRVRANIDISSAAAGTVTEGTDASSSGSQYCEGI